MDKSQLESVKNYYGQVLQTNKDLKTSACCTAESLPSYIRPLTRSLHPEVVEKFYGCGSPFPLSLDGRRVLDLGCGSGRDAYLLSQLVGPNGFVIGLDMTEEQLATAETHMNYHMNQFGYSQTNVRFAKGYIEDLKEAGIEDDSVDVIVSNCVVNLSPDKESVFREAFRVLKPGGEIYFSDVFCDRRLPEHLKKDPVFVGECLGGALYIEDFRRLMGKLGCLDYRLVNTSPITLTDSDVEKMAGLTQFYSLTVRAFKLPLEDRCEDYGQVAYYKGTIPQAPHFFDLDDHHRFEKDKPLLVCSNTAAMLTDTRFAPHFKVEGDLNTHYGLFDCNPLPTPSGESAPGVGCC